MAKVDKGVGSKCPACGKDELYTYHVGNNQQYSACHACDYLTDITTVEMHDSYTSDSMSDWDEEPGGDFSGPSSREWGQE